MLFRSSKRAKHALVPWDGMPFSSRSCHRCNMFGPSQQTGDTVCEHCALCQNCCTSDDNCAGSKERAMAMGATGAKRSSAHLRQAQNMEAMRQKVQLLRRRGNDVEAVRGGMCIEPFTGVHRWDLLFGHQPGRVGTADAVGVCTAGFSTFGPCKAPTLGRSFRVADSVALYATGELFWRGQCVANAVVPPKAQAKQLRILTLAGGSAPATPDDDNAAVAAAAATPNDDSGDDAAGANSPASSTPSTPSTPGGSLRPLLFGDRKSVV